MARPSFSTLRFARVLVLGGVALAVVGLLPWAAVVAGADGAGAWPLLVLATVAALAGCFIALVGAGMGRQARALRQLSDERALDSAALAVAEPAGACGDNCSTCTTSCVLQDLRA